MPYGSMLCTSSDWGDTCHKSYMYIGIARSCFFTEQTTNDVVFHRNQTSNVLGLQIVMAVRIDTFVKLNSLRPELYK